jgi:amino-acid N-acetyltransferase
MMTSAVRKAGMSDIAPLLELINGYAAKGIMLPRTEFEMSENIRDFSVMYSGRDLIACGALHFYSPVVGEVRSLAVDPNWKTHGAGRLMVEALIDEARQFSLDAVFAFTYVPGFFRKLEFQEVERGELPLKVCRSSLRTDDLQRLQNLRVPLRFHFVALLNPESLVEDLGLQAVLDERALARPVAHSRLDVVLGAEDLEIAEQSGRDFEVLGYIGMALEVVDGERGERGGGVEDGAQPRRGFGVYYVVGLDAATTLDHAATVGPKLGLLIGIGSCRRKREIRAFEGPLDRASAGCVVERGGERQAGGV